MVCQARISQSTHTSVSIWEFLLIEFGFLCLVRELNRWFIMKDRIFWSFMSLYSIILNWFSHLKKNTNEK